MPSDLWGVALVTVGVLATLAFYADSLNPAGRYARLAVGDLLDGAGFWFPRWPWASVSSC